MNELVACIAKPVADTGKFCTEVIPGQSVPLDLHSLLLPALQKRVTSMPF